MKKIAFLVQLPRGVSPGQRFRIEHFEPFLEEAGYSLSTYPFIDEATFKILYQKGHTFKKIIGVLKGWIRRFVFLFKASGYDYIFLQREAAPVGPPIFEWVLAKILKRKLILDFDDAIWMPDGSKGYNLVNVIKCYWKVKWLCKWSYKISVGNQYLANYALRYNRNVILIPTCVDTENRYTYANNRYNGIKNGAEKVTIGWTGSHSTLKYLDIIVPVLKELETCIDFNFLVICNERPEFELRSLCFLPWSKFTEIEDLKRIDIGVMPLVEDAWSEGKCGFKIIQYMALGIPTVASPVGVNKQIIDHNRNGFLCNTEQEWLDTLVHLIQNEKSRIELGVEGRKKIVQYYSVQNNVAKFISLFS